MRKNIIINTEELQYYLKDLKKIPVITSERQEKIFEEMKTASPEKQDKLKKEMKNICHYLKYQLSRNITII